MIRYVEDHRQRRLRLRVRQTQLTLDSRASQHQVRAGLEVHQELVAVPEGLIPDGVAKSLPLVVVAGKRHVRKGWFHGASEQRGRGPGDLSNKELPRDPLLY